MVNKTFDEESELMLGRTMYSIGVILGALLGLLMGWRFFLSLTAIVQGVYLYHLIKFAKKFKLLGKEDKSK